VIGVRTRKADGTQRRRLFRRSIREIGSYWPHVVALFFVSILATPLTLLTPIPLKIAVENVINGKPPPSWLQTFFPNGTSSSTLLIVAAVLQVLIVLLLEVQVLATNIYQSWVGEHLTLRFRSKLLTNAQRVSFSFHDSRGTSDSIYRIQYDARAIENLTVQTLIPLTVAACTMFAMIVVIFTIDPLLAAVALLVAPVFFAYQRYFRTRMRPRYAEAYAIDSQAMSLMHESLGAFRVVKAFGREDYELDRFVTQARRGAHSRVRLVSAESLFFLAVSVTTAIGTAAVLYVGVRSVQSNRITLGALLVVIGYLAQLYTPLQRLTNASANIQANLATAERAFELLDAAPDTTDHPDARPLRRAAGQFELRHVGFEYESGSPVLQDVSLVIPAGARLGIVGRTGAGKTTLVGLLMRFYDVTTGSILLDGIDIRDYRVADLRRQFSMVLQDPVLFSTSIAENIAYARPNATRDDIVVAARAAGADDFIARLSDGYDTTVGERGLRLSGGERQRVAVARSFLRDAPVLLLDEPTSSVDIATEAAILSTMERLMEGRTVITVAHRLTTLERCDLVVHVDGGGVCQIEPGEAAEALMSSSIA
jgi:ATP-binding cassette subfamily B protein